MSAKQELLTLFRQIGWESACKEAFEQECRNAYLHGLIDKAYDEWDDAKDFVNVLCNRHQRDVSDITLTDLINAFPSVNFENSPAWGFRFFRGRLFCLRDYHKAKELVVSLGEDAFGESYRKRFGKPVPMQSHLFND